MIPAQHPNSDIIKTFLEIVGRGASGRFCQDFVRILKLKGFCEDSGRLLKESRRTQGFLEGFRKESGRILTGSERF